MTVNHTKKVQVEDCYNADAIGIECNPRWGNYKCCRCPSGGKHFILKKEREYNLIENRLEW